MKAVVAIDRLVIADLPLAPAERAHLVSAFEAELGRLIGAGGLPAGAGFATDRVRAPDIALAPNADPARIGCQMAAALYAGIAGARR